jgi:hypothetical protein
VSDAGDGFETLLRTLLWEGYALYPYTSGATKNATPTPFGIVYPALYAATNAGARGSLTLRGLALAAPGAPLAAEVRFLQSSGSRHEAGERCVSFDALPLAELALSSREQAFAEGGLQATVRLSAEELGSELYAVELRVENTTAFTTQDASRGEALEASLLSTLPSLRLGSGRFASPLDEGAALRNENTFPVLATADDDVLLGATIMLPEHPQIAPESRGDLFDGTEIEEALLLHVLVLSDDERASIERDDPAIRAMIERAAAATPAEILALHGRMTLSDPQTEEAAS